MCLGESLKKILKMYPSKRIKAYSGDNSSGKCILGKPGADVTIKSPTGISAYNEYGKMLGNFFFS